MNMESRMTMNRHKAIRDTGLVALILAIVGFAIAAGFGAMYLLKYSEFSLTKKEADSVKTEYSSKITEREETIDRLSAELSDKRDENGLLTRQLNDEKLKTQQENIRAETLAERVEKLNKRIEDLEEGNEAVVRIRAEMAQMEVQVSALKDELQRTRASLTRAQTGLADSKTESEKLEKDLKRTRTELKNALEQVTSATGDRAVKGVLEKQLQERERQVDDLKDSLMKHEAALQKRDEEIATLRETLAKSGTEAKELQKAKEELSKRDREIGRKDAEIQRLTDKAGKAEDDRDGYRREMESLRNALAMKGDVSQQVKALSKELASRDQTIKSKDEEIVALEEKLTKAEEGAKQTADSGKAETGTLQKQLAEKSTQVTNLQKSLQETSKENKDLWSRIKSEKRSAKIIEKGEEFEQIRFITGYWRAGSAMEVQVSDETLTGDKIDIDKDLGHEMGKGCFFVETVASGRFGFMLDYQELTFAGRSVMLEGKNFFGFTYNAGNTVDSEFYVQQIGLGLIANIGAVHKSDTRRIDLGLLLGGRYLMVSGYMLNRTTGDRSSDELHAPVPGVGLRLVGRYRDGIYWLVQGRVMNYDYDEYKLNNFVEAKMAFGFNIMRSLDIEFGYAYSNIHFRRDDSDTIESFHVKLKSEGPYLSVMLTF